MNLGIFLNPGDSLTNLSNSGQADRFIDFFLEPYSQSFKKIYLFSYENEKCDLPPNVILVPKLLNVHRFIYGIFLPLIQYKYISKCNVVRGFGLASCISSLFLWKPFVFNWAFDYISFVKIDKKYQYIPFYFLLEKIAFFKARKVLVATKQKYQTLKGKKFIYLPNGVDMAQFQYHPKNTSKILFVGRFEKQKNLEFMIKALRLTKNKKEITMVGQGSMQNKLRSWSKKYGVKINFVKPMKNRKLATFNRNFSIFLLTSYHEGSPKVLLEAMASGLIPITTNFPTATDVILSGKNGFITSFSEQEYAQAVDKVISDKLLQKKVAKTARLTIEQNFNIQKLVKKEIRVLKNV